MKNFDEKIREKLFDAEMPVSEGIWDAIEMNLERKDRRPRIWFLFFLLLIGVPAVYFSLYFNQSGQSTQDRQNIAEFLDAEKNEYLNQVANDLMEKDDRSEELVNRINTISYPTVNSMFASTDSRSLSFQIASGNRESDELDVSISETSDFVAEASVPSNNLMKEISFLSTNNKARSLEEEEDIRLPRIFTSKSDCPEFKAKWLGWYAYSQLNVSYPFQKLNSDGIEMTDLINQRNETESGLASFAFDAGLGYDFVNGIFVQAGIQYNQINMKFKQTQQDLINTTTSIMIDTIFNPAGEIVLITRDTTVIPVYGERINQATNTFKMIDIPVSVGYRYAINNRLRMTASAGLALNIRNYSKGKMVDYDGDPFEYGGENDDMFRSRVGLSYTGSLGLETVLSERLYATAGLNLRYYSSKFNLENNPVDQRFLNLGISAGIKYRI